MGRFRGRSVNLNRGVVLAALRVTERGEDRDKAWRMLAINPREVFVEIRQLLLLGHVVLTSALIIPMAWALHWWTDALWARVGVYAAVAPLVLGLCGTVETVVRQSRVPRGVAHGVVRGGRIPPDLDLRGDPSILLPSSVVGLVVAAALAVTLGVVDPLDLASWG